MLREGLSVAKKQPAPSAHERKETETLRHLSLMWSGTVPSKVPFLDSWRSPYYEARELRSFFWKKSSYLDTFSNPGDGYKSTHFDCLVVSRFNLQHWSLKRLSPSTCHSKNLKKKNPAHQCLFGQFCDVVHPGQPALSCRKPRMHYLAWAWDSIVMNLNIGRSAGVRKGFLLLTPVETDILPIPKHNFPFTLSRHSMPALFQERY